MKKKRRNERGSELSQSFGLLRAKALGQQSISGFVPSALRLNSTSGNFRYARDTLSASAALTNEADMPKSEKVYFSYSMRRNRKRHSCVDPNQKRLLVGP